MSHRQKGRHKPRHHTHAVKPASMAPRLPALQPIAIAPAAPKDAVPAATAASAAKPTEN